MAYFFVFGFIVPFEDVPPGAPIVPPAPVPAELPSVFETGTGLLLVSEVTAAPVAVAPEAVPSVAPAAGAVAAAAPSAGMLASGAGLAVGAAAAAMSGAGAAGSVLVQAPRATTAERARNEFISFIEADLLNKLTTNSFKPDERRRHVKFE
jgi:hypothetical protein